MRFRFLWLGKTRDAECARLEDTYFNRIKQFVPAERASVTERKKTDPRQAAAQLEREAQNIAKKLTPGGFLVVLSEQGRQFTSEAFAAELQSLLHRNYSDVTFLVGGSHGIPQRVAESADLVWSLGLLTYPHDVARVLVMEQVYRALTIMKGLPYHK